MMPRRLVAVALLTLLARPALTADDEGFKPLFDGKTLSGWEPVGGKAGNWSVVDGDLVTKGDGGGWLSTSKTYGDFTLRLEYKVEAAGNSGVFIRSPRSGDPAYTGMEIQVLDDGDPSYKGLKPAQYTGSVYGVQAAKRGSTKKPGEWNAMEITARGPKILITLNGTTIVDTSLDDHADAADAHPGIKRADGYIGLQSHEDPVRYRNIRVKAL